ncbi:MAG: hypothetical protein J6M62_05385, partial [Selenomonadaceae bacterium]|nr:hypothetical protein [Selenomonadaceae bacterium]
PVVNKRIPGGGTAIIDCQLNNTELDIGFFCKEIGVYAKDPDTGDEVLYSYRNTENYSDYIPPANSNEIQNQIYTLIIVIGQIENVNVTITEGIGSVSRAEYYNHLSDINPHPQFLQVDMNKVKDCKDVWVGNGEQRRLQRMGIGDFRAKLLGGDAATLPELAGRMTQMELEQSNMAFTLANMPDIVISSTEPLNPKAYWIYRKDAESSLPRELFAALELSNMVFYDNLNPATEINTMKVKVNAVTAGSRTIGLDSLAGVHPGESYTLTDGAKSESVQVKSSSKNGGVLRVVCKNDVMNTYDLTKTYIYRTTAGLRNGKLLSAWHSGEEIIFDAKEFKADGIRKLAYAQGLIRHGKLNGVRIRAFASFLDEIAERKNYAVGIGSGTRQTLTLPDANIDYATIRIYVNGNEITNFDANTETSPTEITLTAPNGAAITADYKYNYSDEDWQEMNLVTVQDYGESGIIASKFEYGLKNNEAEKTRACVKWLLEAEDDTAQPVSVYGVAAGFAKAKDVEVEV